MFWRIGQGKSSKRGERHLELPHLAKHARGPDGEPIKHYSENSGTAISAVDTGYRLPSI
jgi:hypothetical protein